MRILGDNIQLIMGVKEVEEAILFLRIRAGVAGRGEGDKDTFELM